jgi:hypothetical protein
VRNIDFERNAMQHSNSYKEYLIKDPLSNFTIISKYKTELSRISKTFPDFRLNPDEKVDSVFTPVDSPNDATSVQYINIYYAYKSHVLLMTESISKSEDSQLKKQAEEYLGTSFCWFYGVTHNAPLTIGIYGGTPEMLEWRWQQCK